MNSVHLDLVIAITKPFEGTNWYTMFSHWKCTIAAAYNLSLHVLQRIILHSECTENNHTFFVARFRFSFLKYDMSD